MSDTVKLVTDLKTYTGALSGNTDQVLVVHNNNETVRVPFDQFKNSQTIPSVPTSPTSDGTEGDISVTEDAVYTYTNGEWGKSPRDLDWGATYLRIDQGAAPLTSDQLIVLQSTLPKATEEGPGIVALANDVTENYPEGYVATPEYVNKRVKELEDLKRGPAGSAAGFGTPSAVANTLNSDSAATVSVVASGDDTAKVFQFTFGIPRGEQGPPGQSFDDLTLAQKEAIGAAARVVVGEYSTVDGEVQSVERASAHGFATVIENSGFLKSLSIQFADSTSSGIYTGDIYLAVFKVTVSGNELVAVSRNSQVFSVNTVAKWEFAPFLVSENTPVYCIGVSTQAIRDYADAITYKVTLRIMTSAALSSGSQNSNKGIITAGDLSSVNIAYVVADTWEQAITVPQGLSAHAENNEVHLDMADRDCVNYLTASKAGLVVSPITILTPPAEGDISSWHTAYGFATGVSESGILRQLSVNCRTVSTSNSYETTPLFCKVWKGSELLGVSLNSQVHGFKHKLQWDFGPLGIQLERDEVYKFNFSDKVHKDSTVYTDGTFAACFSVIPKQNSAAGGILAQNGNIDSAGSGYLPDYKLTIIHPVFAPIEHIYDMTMHLTEEEHANLTRLLSKADQLLALVQ